jgi:hypothetical protein
MKPMPCDPYEESDFIVSPRTVAWLIIIVLVASAAAIVLQNVP